MGQEIQLKLNNNNVSPTVEKVGDGNLQGFTATDLTGAANELKNTLNQLEDAIAYVQSGDTASRTYTAGQFVYLKNHTTLAEGLYTVNSGGIPSGTTVTGHLTADASGGLNSLKNSFAPEVSTATAVTNVTHFGSRNTVLKSGNIVQFSAVLVIDADVVSEGVIATLPYGARISMYVITAIDSSYALPLIIESDGKLKTAFALSSGKALRIAFTYITS